MHQNRVDPWGHIIKTTARGALMGNRGVIHDEHQTIRRNFRLKAWIACVLQFKDRHRKIMTPNRWTELFFLDEATAFAAGHRPCFECRRADANQFKSCWLKGNPEYSFDEKTPIGEIDKLLHAERIDGHGAKVTYRDILSALPDGAFIELDKKAYLVTNGDLHEWSPFGYGAGIIVPAGQSVTVLTPRSIVNAFKAGYKPQISDHSTVNPAAGTPSS